MKRYVCTCDICFKETERLSGVLWHGETYELCPECKAKFDSDKKKLDETRKVLSDEYEAKLKDLKNGYSAQSDAAGKAFYDKWFSKVEKRDDVDNKRDDKKEEGGEPSGNRRGRSFIDFLNFLEETFR